jgi:hypothetical protein
MAAVRRNLDTATRTENKLRRAVSPLQRCSGANQLSQYQAYIKRPNVNQLPLQNVRVLAQIRTSHAPVS